MDLRDQLLEVLGASSASELSGGHQARVFIVKSSAGHPIIAKVVEASGGHVATAQVRVQTINQLAELDAQVCAPVRHAGEFVTRIVADDMPDGLLTCYEFADGREPDPLDAADAAKMGRALSRMHQSMRRLPKVELPLVAALQGEGPELGGPVQILHGDFSAGNLRCADGLIRIFDFDDCGYGPVEFELANSLYMVLFDAVTKHRPETYRRFAEAFISAYRADAGAELDDRNVIQFIGHRISALGRWLDDLASAPVGIRNASPAWREVLRAFVGNAEVRRLYESLV